MAMATSKSEREVRGMEYDWLGCDPNGHVALFSTAGGGYAPPEFLRDTDAHEVAIQQILALPPTTEARFFPALAPHLANTWRLVAERGLYAYDSDPNGGPYHLVAAPLVAAKTDALPPEVAGVATGIRCTAPFENRTVVTSQILGGQS